MSSVIVYKYFMRVMWYRGTHVVFEVSPRCVGCWLIYETQNAARIFRNVAHSDARDLTLCSLGFLNLDPSTDQGVLRYRHRAPTEFRNVGVVLLVARLVASTPWFDLWLQFDQASRPQSEINTADLSRSPGQAYLHSQLGRQTRL